MPAESGTFTDNGGERGAPLEREAIVIGSGFGGAVVACRLEQAGFDVLILERGRRYEARDFPALPAQTRLAPDFRRWTWESDQGLFDVVDLEEIITVQAAGYGGGSLIYANVHLRPPMAAFDERWPDIYRHEETLKPYYDLAAYMLGAAPIGTHDELRDKIVKADQLKRAARKLGREDAFFDPPLAVSSVSGPNVHGVEQRACTGCGGCITGCPETAKNTLDFNYLALAERDGAEVRTECEVVDIVEEEGGRWVVHCLDHRRAETRSFVTSNLFVCAGALHSTRLLARATLLPREAEGGASLAGVGYFPGGDAIGVIYDTKHPQYPSFGPTITTTTVRFDPDDEGSFFLIQDGGYAEPLERLVGTLRAPAWVGRNRLTSAGDGTIGASPIAAPPPSAWVLTPGLEATLMPSFVDAMLDAMKAGDLAPVVSRQLRDAVPKFLERAAEPVLLPAVVDQTIDSAMRERHARWFPYCSSNGVFLRLLRRFEWSLIRCLYGTNEQLAGRAFRAALAGANLDRNEVARRVLSYDDTRAEKRAVLLAMGRDAASGVLHYDPKTDRLTADLDLFRLAPGYSRGEQLMSDIATTLGGELRASPAWAFLGKPVTVHNQGGCRMSVDPAHGVTTVDGQVHGRKGLYVLDGSILCGPVGVNPTATITAIAERNMAVFLRDHEPKKPGRGGYDSDREAAREWGERAMKARWALRPPDAKDVKNVPFTSEPLELTFHEILTGSYFPGAEDPARHDAEYRRLESRGRPAQLIRVELDATVRDLTAFFEDEQHRMDLSGSIEILLPGEAEPHRGRVAGHLDLLSPRLKPYALAPNTVRFAAQDNVARQSRVPHGYTTRKGSPSKLDERYMAYELTLLDEPGLVLTGYKRLRNDPGLDAWRDSSTLFVKLEDRNAPRVLGAGAIHAALDEFLFGQLPSITIKGTTDPERITWATAKFATFFFGTLQRIYLPGVGAALDALFQSNASNGRRVPRERAS